MLKKVQRTDKACPSSATGEVTITAKEVITSTIDELMDKFTNEIHQVKKHVFVIRHQFRVYRILRETMPPESCMIHVDFSENFDGKYATEIQAVHFGGSQQQMTLHTGVLYLKNQTIPDRQVKLGKDIPNAKVLYDILQETPSIQLFYIRTEEIAKITSEMSALKLATVKGTMRLHQVISTRKGEVKYRDVSCVCGLPGTHDCPCFDLKVFQYAAFAAPSCAASTAPSSAASAASSSAALAAPSYAAKAAPSSAAKAAPSSTASTAPSSAAKTASSSAAKAAPSSTASAAPSSAAKTASSSAAKAAPSSTASATPSSAAKAAPSSTAKAAPSSTASAAPSSAAKPARASMCIFCIRYVRNLVKK